MNILILENVDHLDNDYKHFVSKEYDNDNVDVVFNLSYKFESEPEITKETLLEKLEWADKLSVCSSLTENVDKLLPLIQIHKNIKHIDIKYLFSQDILNLCKDLSKNKNDIIFDLVKTRNVTEILIKTFEQPGKYFNKHFYTYTTVPLVYVEKYDCIWHKERTIVPDINDYIYDEIKNDNKTFTINDEDVNTFDSLINEVKAFVQYQKELVLDNSSEDQDELLEEKNNWINILDKYF